MALKDATNTGDPATPAPAPAPEAKKAQAPKPPDDSILLELALYQNYTHRLFTYTKGKPYRFKRNDAISLLSMRDHGRPVWQEYRPVKARKTVNPAVEDVRGRDVPNVDGPEADDILPLSDDGTIEMNPDAQKRIDVGTDDEIQDILNRKDNDEGDVTV